MSAAEQSLEAAVLAYDPTLLQDLYTTGKALPPRRRRTCEVHGHKWDIAQDVSDNRVIEARISYEQHIPDPVLNDTFYIGADTTGRPTLVESPSVVKQRQEASEQEAAQQAQAAAPTEYLDADVGGLGQALWLHAVGMLHLDGTEAHGQTTEVSGHPVALRRCAAGVLADLTAAPFTHYRVKPPDSFLAKRHDKRYSDPDKSIADVWASETNAAPTTLLGRSLDEVEEKDVHWLWPDYIPFGMLSDLVGDVGMGKSFITADLAARLTAGLPMPDGSQSERVNVILVNVEDPAEYNIKRRFRVAGGDPTRCFVLDTVPLPPPPPKPPKRGWGKQAGDADVGDGDEAPPTPQRVPFLLPRDLGTLRLAIQQRNAKLVVIDPFLGVLDRKVDSYKDQDVRSVTSQLKSVAEDTGCAILTIRHPTKGSVGAKLVYRGGGSMGIVAAARAGYFVTEDPDENGVSLFMLAKTNIGKPPPTLRYRIAENSEGHPKIQWLGRSEYTEASLCAREKERHSEQVRLGDLSQDILEVVRNNPSSCVSPDDVEVALLRKHGEKAPNIATVQRKMSMLAANNKLGKLGYARYFDPKRVVEGEMPVRQPPAEAA